MVLSLDEDRVLEEIQAHTRARDVHLDGIHTLLEKYPGRWWSDGGSIDVSRCVDAENAAFEYMSYEMTQLVWANPRWRVSTRRPRAQQFVSEAMQFALNRWTADSDLKTTLEDLAVDYSFAWGVAHVSPQPTPETYEAEDPILWPQLSRISPWDFGMDHRAPSARRARMLWHRYRIDKDDLVERAKIDRTRPRAKREGWIMSAIRELHETTAADSWLTNQKKPHGDQLGSGFDEPDREQVEVVEAYFPGMQLPGKPGPEDGFNGTLATYGFAGGRDGTLVTLRPPRPFFGPRWGPYTVLGAYIVPDNPWPLSLLAATAGQVLQAQHIANKIDEQVASYKRLGITNDATLAKLINDAKNETTHTYRHTNLEQAYVTHEVGGTIPANVAAEARVLARRDRVMGFAENQRGTTTGDTATDVTYANEAAQGRQGHVRGRFQDGVRRAGKTVAWYLYHTDEIVMPLGAEAIAAFGLEPGEEAWFVGGEHAPGSGYTFDDLGLEIEAYSMERPSEVQLQRQGELLVNVITGIAPALPMIAQMGGDAKGILDAVGDAYGYPKLSKLFPGIESVDLASIQPAEAAPRTGRDAGIAGIFKSLNAGRKMQTVGAQGGAARPADFASAG